MDEYTQEVEYERAYRSEVARVGRIMLEGTEEEQQTVLNTNPREYVSSWYDEDDQIEHEVSREE